jgi:hypothetical protein
MTIINAARANAALQTTVPMLALNAGTSLQQAAQ